MRDAEFAIQYLIERERLKEALKYEGSLIEFASYVWGVVDPAIPFERGWAIEAVAEHLEAVTRGEIKRLLINVPPGFTKSLMTDVFWPAWEWGPQNKPHYRYICASYSEAITVRDNLRCRNVVLSDRYQEFWGKRFSVSTEQFSKIKFANDKTGWKLATSIGGIGVGERGDRFICDDPNNTMEMESEAARKNTEMWFTEVVPDRLNNMKESAIIVIMQRLHQGDVSGIALSRNMGYTHLMIPMEHDTARHCKTFVHGNLFWDDPREEDGELAWEERFPIDVVKKLQNDKGPYAYGANYQQSPHPRGGEIIKDTYWKVWDKPKYPKLEFVLASLDPAYTAKQSNDYSALTIWGCFREETISTDRAGNTIVVQLNPKVILMYAWKARLEFNDLIQRVVDTCTVDDRKVRCWRHGPEEQCRCKPIRLPVDRLLIEAKASGISVAQEMRRLYSLSGKFGIELINLKSNMDKVARVHSIQHLFSEGLVYAPDKEYADMVIDEFRFFPRGSHDDLVDSTSMAMRYLRDHSFMLRPDEREMDDAEERAYTKSPQALYPV